MGINDLQTGQILTNDEVAATFQCSTNGGMRRAHKTNSLVIVSSHVKAIYEDRWIDGVLHYTGMGLTGDQKLNYAQNKTVAESHTNGVALHLFEAFKANEYIYQGEVVLVDRPYQEVQPDSDEQDRNVWMFPLQLKDGSVPIVDINLTREVEEKAERKVKKLSDTELLKRAKAAPKKAGSRTVQTNQAQRDPNVSAYVKRRAAGHCELCTEPAPFKNKQGEPYLESHHIVWLSNGGEDSIANAVALCPNCHRKMHILNSNSDLDTLMDKIIP